MSKSKNDPNSRHLDDQKVLADLHKKSPTGPCFWKHEYGTSSNKCIKIPPGQYDTHACHYRANGIRQAEKSPGVYNTRRVPGSRTEAARKDNQQVAKKLGYITQDGRTRELKASTKTADYNKSAQDIAKKKNASEKGKGTRFLAAYRSRYGNALGRLAQDPYAWDVKYQMMLVPKDFKVTYGATKDNKARDYTKLLKRVGTELDAKTTLGPINFHIEQADAPGNKGFGKWYPYEHDHHHMIPASAFQECVLNGESEDPALMNYMSRARVVMQGTWNIHHEDNMILLPNEVYPARILDLAAHIPWQMGADHPSYSRDLKRQLQPIKKILDKALKVPKKERHKAEKEAAARFSAQMKQVCDDQRKALLKKGFHILEPH
jgi:hypothetical protein